MLRRALVALTAALVLTGVTAVPVGALEILGNNDLNNSLQINDCGAVLRVSLDDRLAAQVFHLEATFDVEYIDLWLDRGSDTSASPPTVELHWAAVTGSRATYQAAWGVHPTRPTITSLTAPPVLRHGRHRYTVPAGARRLAPGDYAVVVHGEKDSTVRLRATRCAVERYIEPGINDRLSDTDRRLTTVAIEDNSLGLHLSPGMGVLKGWFSDEEKILLLAVHGERPQASALTSSGTGRSAPGDDDAGGVGKQEIGPGENDPGKSGPGSAVNRGEPGRGSGGAVSGAGAASGADDRDGGGSVASSEATVFVANGWSPADIGVAATLSARTADSAVLYSTAGRLSSAARDVLDEEMPAAVVLVGGELALGEQVMSAARDASGSSSVTRITGTTRTHTAALAARQVLGSPDDAGDVTVIVVNGWSPADIGAAAALAARTERSAVLYTDAGALSEPAETLVSDYQPAKIFVIGGSAAVSEAAAASLSAAAPDAALRRIAGTDRAATAAAVARTSLGDHAAHTTSRTLIVANGTSASDIGIAASLAARTPDSAVAYVNAADAPAATLELIGDYTPQQMLIVGGTTAVTTHTENAIRDAAPDATINRITGATRTHTAAAAARHILR